MSCDLLNPREIDEMIEEIHKQFEDGIDILVNNAGSCATVKNILLCISKTTTRMTFLSLQHSPKKDAT